MAVMCYVSSSSSSSSSVPVVVVFLVGSLLLIVGHHKPVPSLQERLDSLRFADSSVISFDQAELDRASGDFGMLAREVPAAVMHPASERDVAKLVKFSHAEVRPFHIAARGRSHSVRGQALARGGVVVEMAALRKGRDRIKVTCSGRDQGECYVDAGGEQLWADVLRETLKHGLAPRSWTDYLYLTVGGTLSNAGISGQSFLHGPQISNVHELDVVTGKGEIETCSEQQEADLFLAVLGGLGQFGIITRARIALEPAPQMVRWVRLIYTDFKAFSHDQERLISAIDGFNYVEGSIIMANSLANNWRSSFYLEDDIKRIKGLSDEHGAVYCSEVAKYYHHAAANSMDEEMKLLLGDLRFEPGFQFKTDVTYMNFLDRVREGEVKLQSRGLWDVPHPWLNILVPRSRIVDFDRGVFKNILEHSDNNSVGPILIYATNRGKWNQRTSAVIPDEQVFYSIGILRSGSGDDWKKLEQQNEEILDFCDKAGIDYKQYLPHYTSTSDWMKHFGAKWSLFVERKMRYDPKTLLAPGQQIFTSSYSQRSSL